MGKDLTNIVTNITTTDNSSYLQHSKTEENLKEIARKVNADKVKRSLNNDQQVKNNLKFHRN